MHHLDSWIKIDQLDVTYFIISLFTTQRVSNVSTFIFSSLRLIVDLFHVLYCSGSMCVGVTVWFGWVVWYPYAGWGTSALKQPILANFPGASDPDTMMKLTGRREVLLHVNTLYFNLSSIEVFPLYSPGIVWQIYVEILRSMHQKIKV